MRKKHLFSLAALAATLCVPMTPVLAISPLAPEQIPENLNADQFINLFAGSIVESAQGGYIVRQFTWFSQATLDNAGLIAQGKEIFNTLDPALQQQILAQYQAQQIDYEALCQQANALLNPNPSQTIEPDVPVIQNVPENEQPTNQAPADQTPVQAPADQKNEQTPADSQTDDTSVRPSTAASEQNASTPQPNDNSTSQPPAQDNENPQPDSEAPASDQTDPADSESEPADLTYIQTLKPTEQEQTVLQAVYALQTRPVAENDSDLAGIEPVDETDSELTTTHPVSENIVDLIGTRPVSEKESKDSEKNSESKDDENQTNSSDTASDHNPEDSQDKSDPSEENKPEESISSILDVEPIVPGQPTIVVRPQGEIDPDVKFLEEKRPAGLSFVDDLDAFDANTEKLIQALASKAGFTIFEAHPVTYTFEKDGLSAKSVGLIKVSENCKPVLFQIQNISDHDADILFFNDQSCEVDENGVLKLQNTGSMHIDFLENEQTDINAEGTTDAATDADSESKDDAASNDASNIDKNPDTMDAADAENQGPLQDVNPVEETAGEETAGEEPSADEESAQVLAKLIPEAAASKQVAEVLSTDGTLPLISADESTSSKDTAANDFINQYCLYGGQVIKEANASNYKTLLGGAKAWNALSNVSRTTVNNYLNNMGSTRWQLLYQQANRIRLGLPASGTSTSRTPATGVESEVLSYLAIAGISGEIMIYCASKTRKSKADKSA